MEARPGSQFADWLAGIGALPADDRILAENVGLQFSTLDRGDSVIWENDRDKQFILVTSGLLVFHQLVRTGHRPILGLYLSGDLISPLAYSSSRNAFAIQSLTRSQIATIPVSVLDDLTTQSAWVAKALWLNSRREMVCAQAWLTNIGIRDARARLANFLCEFAVRLGRDDIGKKQICEVPLTQQDLGNMFGLTAIHINRTLRALGDEGVISRYGQTLIIEDWDTLTLIGDFDPSYIRG